MTLVFLHLQAEIQGYRRVGGNVTTILATSFVCSYMGNVTYNNVSQVCLQDVLDTTVGV